MKMIQWQESDIQVNGVRLHVYRSGDGGLNRSADPVVFVHGFTDNGLYFTRAAEALAADHDIVLYDGRGHGRSQRAEGLFSYAALTGDLLGVIETLGLERPGLIGHSLGAATVALLAAQKPDLPRWLLLEDPAWVEARPAEEQDAEEYARARAEYFGDWRKLIEKLQSLPYEDAVALWQEQHPLWQDSDTRRSVDARRQFEIDLFNHFPQDGLPWREVVKAIRCPFLLLTGEPDQGGIVSSEMAGEALPLNPGGRWVKVDGAGHGIRFDRFDGYLEAVRSFLREVLNLTTKGTKDTK